TLRERVQLLRGPELHAEIAREPLQQVLRALRSEDGRHLVERQPAELELVPRCLRRAHGGESALLSSSSAMRCSARSLAARMSSRMRSVSRLCSAIAIERAWAVLTSWMSVLVP